MARKRPRNTGEFVTFDVVYADGTRSSNRKVPSAELEGVDGDAAARGIIAAQDKKVADLSGRPPRDIKSVTRSTG